MGVSIQKKCPESEGLERKINPKLGGTSLWSYILRRLRLLKFMSFRPAGARERCHLKNKRKQTNKI